MGLIFANDVDYAKPLVAAGWNVVAVGTDARLVLQSRRRHEARSAELNAVASSSEVNPNPLPTLRGSRIGAADSRG